MRGAPQHLAPNTTKTPTHVPQHASSFLPHLQPGLRTGLLLLLPLPPPPPLINSGAKQPCGLSPSHQPALSTQMAVAAATTTTTVKLLHTSSRLCWARADDAAHILQTRASSIGLPQLLTATLLLLLLLLLLPLVAPCCVLTS
jgi:hypothetical protein